jgi:uncharacterized membrane protein YebE (DUF533 family)
METTLNDPAQLLSLFLEGALGRSGRKQTRKAMRFISGRKGLITASGVLAAAGVAWGIFDSLKQQGGAAPVASGSDGFAPASGLASTAAGVTTPPPLPSTIPAEVLRVVRLAVSAARADGELSPPERAMILEHARRAGVETEAVSELDRPHPLADIVSGVAEEAARHDLYTLAFAIVRADESVTGGERIYLAQLAHLLKIDAATTARLESSAAAGIDGAGAE